MVNSAFIQGEDILNHYPDIMYDNGYSFSWGIRGVAIVGVLFGVGILYFGGFALILGPIFILAGGFAATSWIGTEICYETRFVRDFHSAFWRRSGKWVPTDHFPDVSILKLGKKQSGEDALGTEVNKVDMSQCEVFLMTPDHRRRLLIRKCRNMEEAVETAEFICQKLDKRLAKFNPASAGTSRRK